MNHSIEQEIEKYFGDALRQHGFQPIYRETTSVGACIIYASDACRLRFVKERTDTNLDVGGENASMSASGDVNWISLFQMFDFIEDKRSVAHLFTWNATHDYDQTMREMAQRLNLHAPILLSWFEPTNFSQRLKLFEAYVAWQRAEMKRYRRSNF